MDPAFRPVHTLLAGLLPADDELVHPESGVRSRIVGCEIETSIELDVTVDGDGRVQIAATPPLYRVDTSLRPSYHQVRFTAHRAEADDG